MCDISREKFLDSVKTGDLILLTKNRWHTYVTSKIIGETVDRVFMLLKRSDGAILYIDVIDEPNKNVYPIKNIFDKLDSLEYTRMLVKKICINRTQKFTKEMNEHINEAISMKDAPQSCLKEKILVKLDLVASAPKNSYMSAIVASYILSKMQITSTVNWANVHPYDYYGWPNSNIGLKRHIYEENWSNVIDTPSSI